MLTDRIKLIFTAGKGGDGAVYFDVNRKPSGGDGGNGGSIYLEGTNSLYDLSKLKRLKKIKADDGERGGKANKTGADAEDIIVKVPITTVVKLGEDELFRINEIGQKELLVKGGRGGFGNYYFRRGQMNTRNKYTKGLDGESKLITLDLQLQADVLFVGLPNAGKSSMLNTLTNANVKVADYPFTTLEPHLGVVDSIILMDLPGFIEGASQGKGIGKEFTKHFKSASLIAHFISLENNDLLKTYKVIREELKELDARLADLPEIIILSKSDLFSEDDIGLKLEQLEKVNSKKIVTTSFSFDKVPEIVNTIKSYVQK